MDPLSHRDTYISESECSNLSIYTMMLYARQLVPEQVTKHEFYTSLLKSVLVGTQRESNKEMTK